MSKLYVGNLSFSTTEATLREAFEGDGRKVVKISLILDRETGRSRGFAFIEMSSPADAESAISACNDMELDGRRMKVNEAREREARGPRNFGGQRPGGSSPRPNRNFNDRGPSRGPRSEGGPRGSGPRSSGGPRSGGGGYGGAPRRPPMDFNEKPEKDTGRKRKEKPNKKKKYGGKKDSWDEGEVRGKRDRKRDDRW